MFVEHPTSVSQADGSSQAGRELPAPSTRTMDLAATFVTVAIGNNPHVTFGNMLDSSVDDGCLR